MYIYIIIHIYYIYIIIYIYISYIYYNTYIYIYFFYSRHLHKISVTNLHSPGKNKLSYLRGKVKIKT